ncbi:MAG: trypsin-like peptidase domain-containing protein [Planctomycetota bacterium]
MRTLALLLAFAAAASAGELRKAESEVIRLLKKVRPSVVTVLTPEKRDFDMSGVVVASNGVVLTLRSPLLSKLGTLPEKVWIRVAGAKNTIEATPLDEDQDTDTALLSAPALRNRHLRIGSVADKGTGEWVVLVGNTFGAGRETTPSSSLGVISGTVRSQDTIVGLHVSTLVNPGSAGAPVLDASGLLMGIVVPKVTGAGGQTVVMPIDRIRAHYRSAGTPGRRVFPMHHAKPTPGRTMTGAFGLVVSAATRLGQRALVGVRADRGEGDADEPPPQKGKRRQLRKRPRVPGKLDAWDRCSGTIVGKDVVICPLRITGWPNTRRRMVVDLLDGSTLPASILGTDERLRIALLKVQREDLTPLEPAARGSVRSGRFAIALGYPHENPGVSTPQVTVGVISRTEALQQMHPAMRALQTDAGVSGGNRGGPLVDIDGKLLGVLLDVDDTNRQGYVSKKRGAYEGNAGLGFALPMEVIERVLPRMRQGIEFKPGFLGVTSRPDGRGLRILTVAPTNKAKEVTAAAKAGLKAGDLLVEINGKPIRETIELQRELAQFMVGDEIELAWMRDDQRKTAKVKLGSR